MVKTKLLGGLGNQMFQYAIAKNLSLRNKTKLYLDLSSLLSRGEAVGYTFRDFELDIFDIKYSIENKKPKTLITRLKSKIRPLKVVRERDHTFHPEVLMLRGNIYLDGHWQNENYFTDIKTNILEDFSFKIPPDPSNEELLRQIMGVNSVSVHFRRGDYVTNPNANDYHGICSDEYYITALNIIQREVPNPHFFVFSDDIEAIKSSFTFNTDVTYVDNNPGKKSYEDMRLMAACQHNIIANSSFSWWGAWLNRNPQKKVIAPKNWFKQLESDIVPKEWIKI